MFVCLYINTIKLCNFILYTCSGGASGSPSGESIEGEGTSEGDNLVVIRSGDVITLDGSGGRILPGNMQPTISLAQVKVTMQVSFFQTF